MELLASIAEYWSMRAEGYSESVNRNLDSLESGSWLRRISKYSDLGSPMRILDAGTGPGFFPMLLGGQGHDVTAIDCTEAMLRESERNCRERGAEARFLRMDAQDLDVPDGSFDLVLSRNLIWNLERPERAYREWLRVLAPGGRMIVFDGNHYLHLYDRDYSENSRLALEHPRVNIDGVDTWIIREIARDLPLSRERRPQWDLGVLMEAGAVSVSAEFEPGETVRVDSPRGTVFLPDRFTICAVK